MMSSKKARKPLTNNMFLSPASSMGSPAFSEAGLSDVSTPVNFLEPPNQLMLSSRRGRERYAKFPAANFSAARDGDEGDESLMSKMTASIPGAASMRAVPSFGDMSKYIGALGLGSPAVERKTLESELAGGSGEYGAEWPSASANDTSRHMFETSSRHSEDPGDVSFAPSVMSVATRGDRHVSTNLNPAIVALQSALEPEKKGKALEQDEHILPVGCLRDSPVETFYGLSLAVAARPAHWTDLQTTHQPRITAGDASTSPKILQSTAAMRSVLSLPPMSDLPGGADGPDPWDVTLYASENDDRSNGGDTAVSSLRMKGKGREDAVMMDDEDGSERDWRHEPDLAKRASALIRLNQSFVTRRHSIMSRASDDDDNDDTFDLIDRDRDTRGYEEADERYDAKALARRLQHTSLETFFEVWLILQFIMVLVVFVYSSVRQGPRAVMLGQNGRSVVKSRRTV